jgi:hypothetical protein
MGAGYWLTLRRSEKFGRTSFGMREPFLSRAIYYEFENNRFHRGNFVLL